MSRVLTIFDLQNASRERLRPWLDNSAGLNLLVRPLPGIALEEWRSPTRLLPGYDGAAAQYLQVLRPLFEMALRDEGPRATAADIGFLAACEYSLFSHGRFAWALLLELQSLADEHSIARLELITDQWHGGRCCAGVKSFASSVKKPWKLTILGTVANRLKRHALRLRGAVARVPAASTILDWLGNLPRSAQATLRARQVNRSSLTVQGNVASLTVGMLVYQPKSWRNLLPIRQELLQRGHRVVLLSPRSATEGPLTAAGLPFVRLRAVAPLQPLLAQVRHLLNHVVLNVSSAVEQKLAMPDAPLRHLLSEIASELTIEYATYAGQLSRLFSELEINCVLGTDSGSVAGRTFFRTAEARGIPSVFVQHGAFSQEPSVAEYFTQSQKLLWGTSSRESLIRSSVADDASLVVVGSPFVEEELEPRLAEAGTIRSDAPTVLVTFGVPGNTISERAFELAANEVIAAARSCPDLRFLVKPHPGDRTSLWNGLVEAVALRNVDLCPFAETYSLMTACQALVTMFSTTGAEAAFLGKPVVSVNLDGIDWGMDYIEANAAYVARVSGELGTILRDIFAHPPGQDRLALSRRDFARAFLHREPTSARERVVNQIEQMHLARETTVQHT
jgi:hypothetical protein